MRVSFPAPNTEKRHSLSGVFFCALFCRQHWKKRLLPLFSFQWVLLKTIISHAFLYIKTYIEIRSQDVPVFR